MKDGLLEDLRAIGHWRLNIQPLRHDLPPLSLRTAKLKVANARVQMRGWDFPHVSVRNDESGGEEIHNTFVENWCDWHNHREFWRIYQSSQFIAYKALWEDLPAPPGERARPAGRLLSVQGAIWSVIEFFEFANRIACQNLYIDGAKITVNLRNANGRRLWVTEWNRLDFSYPRVAAAPDIDFVCTLQRTELLLSYKPAAIDVLMHIFTLFNWEVSRDQLEREQTKYYNRDYE